MVETLAKVFAKAEEVAAEREERTRRLELEVEERRKEADDRREERMMTFFAGLMQSVPTVSAGIPTTYSISVLST